eukprot:14591701-Ditylum_brightwellii.AAC.1
MTEFIKILAVTRSAVGVLTLKGYSTQSLPTTRCAWVRSAFWGWRSVSGSMMDQANIPVGECISDLYALVTN